MEKNENDTITPPLLAVEVAYAKLEQQVLIPLRVPENTTVQRAIELSGILLKFPEIDLNQNKIGIFSKPCKLAQTVRMGDRIEIYRPLIADPKAVRKQRAAEGKTMKKGG
ncbi:RnfH family protein [Thioflexithrix psekupsensis]|uniref:UPF0125 protein TPSD3_06675 n=1 Tax=Thioflexithrix psekupsensis TaxID=1570016 RepID=A0A251X7R8_9GAMM|nr:RnfH family protein [Thioflexithrix psekupsensis]OUD14021.1 RnfH family protein [Thioflexithrix psekupsensis]